MAQSIPYDSDLDTVLINFTSENSKAGWTIREAVEGVQIFGGIGSGKTSGSGRTIALKYLSHGFGGLVLTAKPDEKDLWVEYCRKTNRSNDLIIVEPNGIQFFNFLEYESNYKVDGASITENIVQVLKTVIQASEEKSNGNTNDPFWENALDMLIFNTIDLCLIAYGKATIQQMYNIVQTAPQGKIKFDDKPKVDTFMYAFGLAEKNIKKQIDQLFESLSDFDKKRWQSEKGFQEKSIFDQLPDAALFRFLEQFFFETYAVLSEKTRSIIEFSFTGFLFRLMKEPINSLFCSNDSTFTPEDSLKGKIILLNLPVKTYFKVGRDIQVMFKYIWQRAMERRNIKNNDRPVFLWADEAQNFLHEYDADYQATARSSRIATVYISQNLPNYHANMGGHSSEYRVKSFLGTLATKIFHANADIETNNYASDLIGKAYMESVQRSKTLAGDFSATESTSFDLENLVRPEQFAGLKTGSPENNFLVEAYVHRQSRQFSKDKNFKKITFIQQ